MRISETLIRRGLRPLTELAADRPHGDRLKYHAGCRCLPCRAANSQYEAMRAAARKAGDWNGLVPAKSARAHIRKLGKQGVGYKSVAEASGVATSMIFAILSSRKRRIRARTERRILAVTKEAIADRALVSSANTWRLIGRMLDEGYTKSAIARMLGSTAKTPALQIGKFTCTARTASKVERLWRQMQR